MQVNDTSLGGVKLVVPPTIHEDFRGAYVETYNEKIYYDHGINIKFVQDDISVSSRNVLRGIHGDNETWKLVSCLFGKFYLVVVDCDKNSRLFGKWEAFTLSDTNRLQVLIPPGFGNGHLVLSNQTIFHYKQSTYYAPEKQFTYKWNDPDLAISWPTESPILSRRDEIGAFPK